MEKVEKINLELSQRDSEIQILQQTISTNASQTQVSMIGETVMEKVKGKAEYVSELNRILKDDEYCTKHLPLNADDNSLFAAFGDGIFMSRLMLAVDSKCLK